MGHFHRNDIKDRHNSYTQLFWYLLHVYETPPRRTANILDNKCADGFTQLVECSDQWELSRTLFAGMGFLKLTTIYFIHGGMLQSGTKYIIGNTYDYGIAQNQSACRD